jgi:hypothetical protein
LHYYSRKLTRIDFQSGNELTITPHVVYYILGHKSTPFPKKDTVKASMLQVVALCVKLFVKLNILFHMSYEDHNCVLQVHMGIVSTHTCS